MSLPRIALATAAALLLSSCSTLSSLWPFGEKAADYKGASARTVKPLEVPPELTSPTMDDRYAIPDPRAQTTYSQYAQRTGPNGEVQPATGEAVLPRIEGTRLERVGDQRWLVVKGDPQVVWPVVRDFWVEAGYPLAREQADIGIMETEWYEDRSKIPQDFVRRTIGRVFDNLFSTARRDRFRTRLERGVEPGTTEVFVSNRAMEEVYTTAQQDATRWQPLPADRELEAEMLARIQAKIGGKDAKIAAAAASAKAPAPVRTTQAPAPETPKNAVLEGAGAGPLVVNDAFDRAWRRVGLALDRVGFTVEDRDRSKGVFFVRYIDPDVDLKAAASKKEGWLDKLMFWRPAARQAAPQYRILVADAGGSNSQVTVQDGKGQPETSPTSKRILALLYDQLK